MCSYPRTMQAFQCTPPRTDASHNITTTQDEHKTQTITPLHPEHDLTLYKEATAQCHTGSITCPWSLMQFGFVIVCILFLHL